MARALGGLAQGEAGGAHAVVAGNPGACFVPPYDEVGPKRLRAVLERDR